MTLPSINYRRLGLTLLFLFAVIIFGLLLYIFFFKPAPQRPVTQENINADGELPITNEPLVLPKENINQPISLTQEQNINAALQASPSARGGLTYISTLSSLQAKGFTLSSNGNNMLFWNSEDSKFYQINPDGKAALLIDQRFYDIDNIAYASTKDKAIIEFPDGANVSYNFTSKEQVTLPKHWEDFHFAPKGDTVALKSMGLNPENNWLAISNPDGSGSKPIQGLGTNADKVLINWSPDMIVVAMFVTAATDTRSSGPSEQQEVFFIGKNDENFKSMLVEGFNFEPRWSKTGDRLLYSVHNGLSDYKPELWVVNAQGNAIGTERRNLKIQTWAHKCAFVTNNEVYCAVPENIGTGYGFYPELNNTTPDRFYKINLATGTRSLLAQPDGNFTVNEMFISEDGQYLYFTDINTGKLHKITL